MTAPTTFTHTDTVDFPDGARLETTTVYTPATTAPTPPPARRQAGIHDWRAPAITRSVFPAAVLTRPFVNNVLTGPRSLISLVDAACRPSWTAGLTPICSIKLDPAEVLNGAWASPIRELADWYHDQPPGELVVHHEPEDDVPLQGGVFVTYFNRIAEQVRVANDMLPLIYAAMGYQWLPGKVNGTVKGFTSTPAHWQGIEADRFDIDVYSGNSVPLATILPEHKGWQRWMEYVVGDRDWGAAERGFITGTEHAARAAAIAREKEWLLTDPVGRRCRSYAYWNTMGAEKNPAIVVDAVHGEPAVQDLLAALNS